MSSLSSIIYIFHKCLITTIGGAKNVCILADISKSQFLLPNISIGIGLKNDLSGCNLYMFALVMNLHSPHPSTQLRCSCLSSFSRSLSDVSVTCFVCIRIYFSCTWAHCALIDTPTLHLSRSVNIYLFFAIFLLFYFIHSFSTRCLVSL